jgi:DNA-binding beta-propeller fold protein YncE
MSVVIVGVASAQAQVAQQQWVGVYGVGFHAAAPQAMVVGSDPQTVYVTGQLDHSFDHSDTRWGTVAFDAESGAQVWAAEYPWPSGHTGGNRPDAIVLSDDGRTVYVAGTCEKSTTLGLDYLTLAYDAATGNLLWEARAPYPDVYSRVALKADGNIVYLSTMGLHPPPHTGGYLTIAYDAITGVELWQQYATLPAGGLEFAYLMELDHAGGLYAGGWAAA